MVQNGEDLQVHLEGNGHKESRGMHADALGQLLEVHGEEAANLVLVTPELDGSVLAASGEDGLDHGRGDVEDLLLVVAGGKEGFHGLFVGVELECVK